MAERLRSGTSIGVFGREEGSLRGPLSVQGSGRSRGSLLAPHSAKQVQPPAATTRIPSPSNY